LSEKPKKSREFSGFCDLTAKSLRDFSVGFLVLSATTFPPTHRPFVAYNVVNFLLSAKVLALPNKKENRPGLVDPLAYYLRST
ncbi:MAG: hypothetical protein K5746_11210, partial [Clostridiales bacterium]|nr:hypothetical protein [Clostridiales bacterium]